MNAGYASMIRSFLTRETSAEDFSRAFHEAIMSDRVEDQTRHSVLMQLFFSIQSFTTVTGLVDESPDKFIDEAQLRLDAEKCAAALASMREI